jgi:hypothetical protein
MLLHETQDVNYWLYGGAIFVIMLMLQYALFGDYRAAVIYALVIAGAFVIIHRLINRSVKAHNKL